MKLLKEMDGTSKQTQKVVARYRKQWRDYLQWCRPLTEEKIGAANYNCYYQSTFAEFEHLLPELPVFEQAANNNNFHRLPFALSQYRVLLGEFGYTQEAAFETLDALVSEQCRQELEHSPAMRGFMGMMHTWPWLFRQLMGTQIRLSEASGWLFDASEHREASWAFNCTQCGLMLWLTEQGAPEICPVFCNTDYVTAAYMTGLKLVRTKTIGYGDALCDFGYYGEAWQPDKTLSLK